MTEATPKSKGSNSAEENKLQDQFLALEIIFGFTLPLYT